MRILVVPGDGIGPEVMHEAKRLLHTIAERFAIEFVLDEVDWGAERWLRERIGIPEGVITELPNRYDAILFGALGDPRIPDMAHGREILLNLRFGLDLFINMRPIKLLHPALGVLKRAADTIDMIIFRENTEDIYLGFGEVLHEGTVDEITIDESRHTFLGVERIIVSAFDYAIRHGRHHVTMVDKSNAIKFGGRLWQRTFSLVSKRYPGIKSDHLFVDVAAMQLVQNPAIFDVIVTSNLFGDILSDLGAAITGGLGLAASVNINPGVIALFEPVHGSAPDIVGKNIANPFAIFLSVALMMTYFGYYDAASLIEISVIKAIDTHATTPDLGGTLSTTQAADYILGFIGRN
jgi:3-isopropylmalate dehydrogenase